MLRVDVPTHWQCAAGALQRRLLGTRSRRIRERCRVCGPTRQAPRPASTATISTCSLREAAALDRVPRDHRGKRCQHAARAAEPALRLGRVTARSGHFQESFVGKQGFDEHCAAPTFAAWEAFAASDPFTAEPSVRFAFRDVRGRGPRAVRLRRRVPGGAGLRAARVLNRARDGVARDI